MSIVEEAVEAMNIFLLQKEIIFKKLFSIRAERTFPKGILEFILDGFIDSTHPFFAHVGLDTKNALFMYAMGVGQDSTGQNSTSTIHFQTVLSPVKVGYIFCSMNITLED